jgi:hypothetical protein
MAPIRNGVDGVAEFVIDLLTPETLLQTIHTSATISPDRTHLVIVAIQAWRV